MVKTSLRSDPAAVGSIEDGIESVVRTENRRCVAPFSMDGADSYCSCSWSSQLEWQSPAVKMWPGLHVSLSVDMAPSSSWSFCTSLVPCGLLLHLFSIMGCEMQASRWEFKHFTGQFQTMRIACGTFSIQSPLTALRLSTQHWPPRSFLRDVILTYWSGLQNRSILQLICWCRVE